jgi:hypothetical protein
VGIMMLSINLAREIGLRPTCRALKIFFAWQEIEERVPTYQTIRGWMQRLGLARMTNAKKRDGGNWIVDHTNQISKQKVLVILRATKFQPGTPLRHRDLEVLALRPGVQWKREDVQSVYESTAEQYGFPEAIISDGAVELREPAEKLKKGRKKPRVQRDPKHFFANRLEALLSRDPQYQSFMSQLGGTRSALSQTELAQFIPPGMKVKARFMNLGPTLNWASATLWHLKHPQSKSRKGITKNRFREKLGWLSGFSGKIQQWQQCQDIIDSGLAFLNQQGIFKGCSRQFKRRVRCFANCAQSRAFLQELVTFLESQERLLRGKNHLPCSTEILESGFSLYKALEKQHSKSGFTNLLLAIPVLLRETTSKEVEAAFSKIKVSDVKQWTAENCPTTLTAKRQLMFREAGKNRATRKRATQEMAAA